MLKFTVISIGIALVGGMILLFTVIYQRHSKSVSVDKCAREKVSVPINGAVISMVQEGDKITLLTRGNRTTQEIIVLDSCQNTVINRITLAKTAAAE